MTPSQVSPSSPIVYRPTPGLAISLSSGFYGFYTHAAFVVELHRAGYFPEQIMGTSAGALVGLVCGMGLTGQAVSDFFWQPGVRSSFLDWLAPLRVPGLVTSSYGSGILSGKNALRFLYSKLGHPRLEDFKCPRVHFAVTNLSRMEAQIVREGDAVAFALASCSIPGLFCNQIINGERWCDGAVSMHVPFDDWTNDDSIDTIVFHRLEHEPGTELTPKWPTLSTGFAKCHQIIGDEIFKVRLRELERSGKRIIDVVTMAPHPRLVPTRERYALVEAGKKSGLKVVAALKGELAVEALTPVVAG